MSFCCSYYIFWYILTFCVCVSKCLMCYNCSTMNSEWTQCAGDFVHSVINFNNSNMFLLNCSGENSMCFVRSWSARAHHSWLVQRGCYQPQRDDPLPHSLNTPTRAMTCRHERLPDGEYKVCLCQSDWCNSSSIHFSQSRFMMTCKYIFIFILMYSIH